MEDVLTLIIMISFILRLTLSMFLVQSITFLLYVEKSHHHITQTDKKNAFKFCCPRGQLLVDKSLPNPFISSL